jgi:hypothetical protein
VLQGCLREKPQQEAFQGHFSIVEDILGLPEYFLKKLSRTTTDSTTSCFQKPFKTHLKQSLSIFSSKTPSSPISNGFS